MWEKCTTSAECKSIRIAESSVMDGWKGPRSRRMGILCFKKKLFSAKEKGGIKEVPGRYGFWEKMVGLGETTQSDLVERKKGYPHLSVFEKIYKVFYKNVEIVHAISTRENSISKCFV